MYQEIDPKDEHICIREKLQPCRCTFCSPFITTSRFSPEVSSKNTRNGCQDFRVRIPLLIVRPLADTYSTGVTGYIAGDAFSVLQSKHPEYEYTALVRTNQKADVVKKAYPSTRTVIGDLDNSDLLKEEASKADIVLRM